MARHHKNTKNALKTIKKCLKKGSEGIPDAEYEGLIMYLDDLYEESCNVLAYEALLIIGNVLVDGKTAKGQTGRELVDEVREHTREFLLKRNLKGDSDDTTRSSE